MHQYHVSGVQNPGIGDKLRNSSLAVTGVIKTALGNWLNQKSYSPPPPPPDPETLKLRAAESKRLELRVLGRSGKFEEIIGIAETTADSKTVFCALSQIVDQLPQDHLKYLTRLAMSSSMATIPAMISLLNLRQPQLVYEIFSQRLQVGDLHQLVLTGKARVFPILEILSTVEHVIGTEEILNHFASFWQCLSDNPLEQFQLLGRMLGDPEPGGIKYIHEHNVIGKSLKLKAIELLSQGSPTEVERYLCYAAKDADDDVAYSATIALINWWQTEAGRVPAHLEPFPMLDLNQLFQLSQISSSFQWHDTIGAQEIYQQYCQLQDQLKRTDSRDQSTPARLQTSIRALDEKTKRITETRVNTLQPMLDSITTALNLPHARLNATDENLCASYLVGTGEIKFSRAVLLEDKPLSEEVMSSMLHEIGHMEQDALIIRAIADELGIKFGQHSKSIFAIFDRYASGIGYAPRSMFLMEVLRLRGDRQLTPAERQRAFRLWQAANERSLTLDQSTSISARLTKIGESCTALQDGTYDRQLLSCLSEPHGLDSLFHNGLIPEILLQEMSSCTEELGRIVNSYYPNHWQKRTRAEIIKTAEQLFLSAYGDQVRPIVQRFKLLLIQILQEEQQTLSKRLSEIKRAGYHESECYTISDRVEVIVKALRKGWFQA